MPYFGERLVNRAGRGGSWLLNLQNRDHGIAGAMSRPLEYFGFNLYGEGAQSSIGFAGFRLQQVPGAQGRTWIPDYDAARSTKGQGFAAGRWGTMGELWRESNAARVAKGGIGGLGRQARMLTTRALIPAAFVGFGIMNYGGRRAAGQGVFEAATKTIAEEGVFALAGRFIVPMITNPAVLAAGVVVGGAALGIHYTNKMAEFRKKVKRTEFVGDMSSFQTHAALTMRQRSLQSIQRSYLNARTALGQEAQFHHMSFAPRGAQRMLAGAM